MNARQSNSPEVTFSPEVKKKKSKNSNVTIKTIEIVRTSNEYKKGSELHLNDFDIKPKQRTENQICPLYCKHSAEKFMIARFDSKCPYKVTAEILKAGIDVHYEGKQIVEHYAFFGHSASQLRQRVCILYNIELGSAENIINDFGDFSKLKTVAKRAARIGLLFSTAEETVKLSEEDVHRIDDVERNGYTFTDGCGYISPDLAEKVSMKLGIVEKYQHQVYKYPSVFQVRLLGCKGVFAVKPSLEKGIEVRKSMEKFRWLLPPPFPLGVVDKGYSKPYEVGSLNKQFILLLSALGISDEIFLEKQKKYFEEIVSLTHNKETAFTYLCAFGEISIAERLLENDSFDKEVLAKVKSIQQRAYISPNSNAPAGDKNKKSPAERLKIPVEKSRNVYGICDPSEILEYGTCFFQPTIRGKAKPIVGNVVVAKNPCYSPGDVRILTCQDVTFCHHLVDCIVFPTAGERPHPDEIAGSDLDGDKFFVCWDPDLVPSRSENPTSYPSAKVPTLNNIQQKNMIEYFSKYSNSTIGMIDSLFATWADRKGVASNECGMLSALFSRAVDSAKTGERVAIPNQLKINAADFPSEEKFVWHKMASRARLFLDDRVKSVTEEIPLAEDTVRNIICNKEISVSEFQLFRFLYKWAMTTYENIQERHLSLCNIAAECIDFTEFTPQQLKRAEIDCPELSRQVLYNPFSRSKILSEFDQKNLALNVENYRPYSMVFRADAEDLSWHVLNNVLTSDFEKILVFKFFIAKISWVFVLNLPLKLEARETLELSESEDTNPRAYLSIDQDTPISKRFVLKGYCLSLDDQRLQIYEQTKNQTFFNFSTTDVDGLSVVSIDLNRFDQRLGTTLGTRLRKEAFVSLEVYCLNPMGAPFPKIHQTDPPAAVEQVQAINQEGSVDKFNITMEDFPSLGKQHGGIFLEAEEELSKLHDLQQNGSLETNNFQKIQDLMAKMKEYPLERCEWACELESLLAKCVIPLGDPDDYLTLLIYVLDGLKKRSFSALIGSKVNVTLLDRIRRVFESMETNNVRFSVENIFQLFETLLFVHDWRTSIFVVQLLKQGRFPIADDDFLSHSNTAAYFSHWTSLVYLEILEEIREQEEQEIKNKANQLNSIAKGVVMGMIEEQPDSFNSWTIFVKEGDVTCSPGDFLALSPSNADFVFSERNYILEVKSVCGKLMSVDVVWPSNKSLTQNIDCNIIPFPNLISCKRMLDALRKLCTAKSLDDVGVFSKLLDMWNLEENGVREESDEREETPQEQLSGLNISQTKAVQHACGSTSITLIQGPPGTGKSKTSANIIQKFLEQHADTKVLAVAETNEGVDNLLAKMVEIGNLIPEHELLRLGSSTWTVRENLRKYTLELRYAESSRGKRVRENKMDSKIVKQILGKARVVFTTCNSAGSKFLESTQFPRVIVDEASQATEPAILVPICNGCKVLVLVGDDKQLPPMVKSIAAGELGDTTFSRLRRAGEKVYLLDTQYRMHPAIAEFPAREFYEEKLKNGVNEEDRQVPKGFCWPKAGRPLAFVEMPDDARETAGRSKSNRKEVSVAKRIITDLLAAGDLQPDDIGVVAPYNAQVHLLKEEMKSCSSQISVRTVDGFQGQEREVIVFSAVRCNDGGHLGFLDDDKRMNVLLTRARRGLIVIGNKKTLKSNKASTWNKWVTWVEEEELIVDSENTRKYWLDPDAQSTEHGRGREGGVTGEERGQREGRQRGGRRRGGGGRGGERGRGGRGRERGGRAGGRGGQGKGARQ